MLAGATNNPLVSFVIPCYNAERTELSESPSCGTIRVGRISGGHGSRTAHTREAQRA